VKHLPHAHRRDPGGARPSAYRHVPPVPLLLALLAPALAAAPLEPDPAPRPGSPAPAQLRLAQAVTNTAPPSPANPQIDQALDYATVSAILEQLDPPQRARLLENPQAFRLFVAREADNRSLARMARSGLTQDATADFLMQRGADNALREYYLQRELQARIDADFPSERQAEDYYRQNRARFTLGERVPLWQIFLPLPAEADTAAKARVKTEADSLYGRLQRGDIDFEAAAGEYSKHEGSRYNGGYMGIVGLSQLRPVFREPLEQLAEGIVSQPLEDEDGFHIVKRGGVLPERVLPYEQIQGRVRQLMRDELQRRLRQELYREARRSAPADPGDVQAESWRRKLREELGAAATGTPARGAAAPRG